MNAIVNMFKNQDVFSGYGEADFDIGETELKYFLPDGQPMTSSKKVVFRTDTGAELGVHSKGYKAVPPKVMIDQARAIILRSELNTDGIQETIKTSHSGSRTFVKYDLPSHTYETPDGDTAALSLLAITSTDSSWPFMISVAAVQRACTNLQVFTSGEVAVFKSKHTSNLDIEHGSRTIVKALETFENERELWAKMVNTHISIRQAFLMFAEAAGCKDKVLEIMEAFPNHGGTQILAEFKRSNTAMQYLWDVYATYRKRFGDTQWAAYNALTDWSTHAGVSRGSVANVASIQYGRQETVRQVVRNNLLAAA